MAKKPNKRRVRIPYESIFNHIKYFAERSGYKVVVEDLNNDMADGDIHVLTKVIRIHDGLSWADKMLTIAHEFFGHACQFAESIEYLKKREEKTGFVESYRTGKPFARTKMGKYYNYLGSLSYEQDDVDTEVKLFEFCEVDASRRAKEMLQSLYLVPEEAIYYKELEVATNPKIAEEMRGVWRMICIEQLAAVSKAGK